GDGLERVVRGAVRMVEDAHAGLIAEVESAALFLNEIDDAQALLVVVEAGRVYLADGALARVSERGVPQVMAQRDGLREVFVELEGARDGARYARDLERVREACAVMVALRLEKDLRLMLEPSKGLAVRNPVDVALEACPYLTFVVGVFTSPAVHG